MESWRKRKVGEVERITATNRLYYRLREDETQPVLENPAYEPVEDG